VVKICGIEKGKMSEDRIKYRNLEVIFVMEIENKNIEVGTIEGYLPPFNKYVVIKNIYKYPERVKEYVEACQFSNVQQLVGKAPLLRTFSPRSTMIEDVVIPALIESFERRIVPSPSPITFSEFSYYSPQSIEYNKYTEPHTDTPNILPLQSKFPHMHPQDEDSSRTIHFHKAETVAGVIFLDETFGTEILVNKDMSYYHSKTTGMHGASPMSSSNENYYPEGNNSHYEHITMIGGEYNSAVFYYGALSHRPYYPGASDEDLKRGRLIQNIWLDDITDAGINEN